MPQEKVRPEIIFGLVGPIGCSIHNVAKALSGVLKEVDYTPIVISLSEIIQKNLPEDADDELKNPKTLQNKIDAGNYVRKHHNKNGILAALSISAIKFHRDSIHKLRGITAPIIDDETAILSDIPAAGTAYILDQLKRPEEVDLLERVYGPRFIQVSVTESLDNVKEHLRNRTVTDQPGLTDGEIERVVTDLIAKDQDEDENPNGQRITSIFHRGDVFIDASDTDATLRTTRRFVHALFGKNEIGPTRDEMGSYHAKAVSLRSVDMSRQVGAAITNKLGDIISLGCNDVPKPMGGQYWYEDNDKARDIDKSHEANKAETARIAFDLLRVLQQSEIIHVSPDDILQDSALRKRILDSKIGEITEYGRMVHAEMAAITDAARLGRSVEDATLYVTTFPCHNCAKHVIASGIRRVVFIEPYPKSKALSLFGHAISQDKSKCDKVIFEHFSGISPKRFRDIFEKGKRRGKDGKINEWYHGIPYPMLRYLDADYILPENSAISDNI